MKKNILSIIILIIISLIFFWKAIFNDQIVFPGDMLVGAYYPWLDFKWGTITGVPIKNPYITDIFSQIYIWKELITKSYLQGFWPLWNPYSYSGYPLLANFQSGAFNIFNIIFIVFGMLEGWNLFLITSILLLIFSMYFYLKSINISSLSSMIASFSFGFSGFSILWMPYTNANFSLASIPLAFYLIEKFKQTLNRRYLYLISPVIFLMISAGHFQISIYGLVIISLYLFYKKVYNFLPIILGLLMSSIQLVPTFELSSLSIRFTEGFIKNNNFGLSPLDKLITLYIPDFFGNPSTFNYWGFFNYHETVFYNGVLGIIALIWACLNYHKLSQTKFFLFCALVSLLLGFDTILGRLIYIFNIPGISTSAAGRISSIFSLSIAILIAKFLDSFYIQKTRQLIKPSLIIIGINLAVILISKYNLKPELVAISLRNNIFPAIILVSITLLILISSKFKYYKILILVIVIVDLFRFGWKSTPFVSKDYVYPKTPLTQYLDQDTSLFRVDREHGPILPPNTWTHYGLSSPSGYDPLAINSYVTTYNKLLNNNNDLSPAVTRYSELFNFSPELLGEFNVKYLLMQKVYSNDKKTYSYNQNFNEKLWTKSFETETYSLFQNKHLKPRFEIVPSSFNITISQYTQNIISLKIETINPNSVLILRDTFYPGWQAYVNGNQVKIDKYNDIYRQVSIPAGQSTIDFKYEPDSFRYGIIITTISSIIFLILMFIL